MHRFGTIGYKVTVAELITWRVSLKMLLDPNLGLARKVVLPLDHRNSSQL
jgi:hypothetical protein